MPVVLRVCVPVLHASAPPPTTSQPGAGGASASVVGDTAVSAAPAEHSLLWLSFNLTPSTTAKMLIRHVRRTVEYRIGFAMDTATTLSINSTAAGAVTAANTRREGSASTSFTARGRGWRRRAGADICDDWAVCLQRSDGVFSFVGSSAGDGSTPILKAPFVSEACWASHLALEAEQQQQRRRLFASTGDLSMTQENQTATAAAAASTGGMAEEANDTLLHTSQHERGTSSIGSVLPSCFTKSKLLFVRRTTSKLACLKGVLLPLTLLRPLADACNGSCRLPLYCAVQVPLAMQVEPLDAPVQPVDESAELQQKASSVSAPHSSPKDAEGSSANDAALQQQRQVTFSPRSTPSEAQETAAITTQLQESDGDELSYPNVSTTLPIDACFSGAPVVLPLKDDGHTTSANVAAPPPELLSGSESMSSGTEKSKASQKRLPGVSPAEAVQGSFVTAAGAAPRTEGYGARRSSPPNSGGGGEESHADISRRFATEALNARRSVAEAEADYRAVCAAYHAAGPPLDATAEEEGGHHRCCSAAGGPASSAAHQDAELLALVQEKLAAQAALEECHQVELTCCHLKTLINCLERDLVETEQRRQLLVSA